MSQINRLQTIDADTLQSTAYEPVSFVVDDLLPQGLHLLRAEDWQIVAGTVAVSLRRAGQTALDLRHTPMRGAVPLSGGQLPTHPKSPL